MPAASAILVTVHRSIIQNQSSYPARLVRRIDELISVELFCTSEFARHFSAQSPSGLPGSEMKVPPSEVEAGGSSVGSLAEINRHAI